MAVIKKQAPRAEEFDLDALNPRAVMGGNEPPLEERIAMEFREGMLTEKPEIYQKLDDLLGIPAEIDPETGEEIKPAVPGSVQRAKAKDEETMANRGKLVNALRQAGQLAERVKKTVKQPYLDGGRAVDAQYNAIAARVTTGINAVLEIQKAYQREEDRKAEVERQRLADLQAAEDKRVADEQAALDAARAKLEQVAKENGLEAALPPPPPPVEPRQTFFESAAPRGPIRTEGATVSTGKEWVIDGVDVVKAVKLVKANTAVIDAITKAVKALVKSTSNNSGKGYPGVDARQDVKISNR